MVHSINLLSSENFLISYQSLTRSPSRKVSGISLCLEILSDRSPTLDSVGLATCFIELAPFFSSRPGSTGVLLNCLQLDSFEWRDYCHGPHEGSDSRTPGETIRSVLQSDPRSGDDHHHEPSTAHEPFHLDQIPTRLKPQQKGRLTCPQIIITD